MSSDKLCEPTSYDLLPITDRAIYKLSGYVAQFLKHFNVTPNYITSLSLLFGLIGIYFFCVGNIWLGVFGLFTSYVLDSVDGCYARIYGMCSSFGDVYDHVKDIFIVLVFISLAVCKFRNLFSPFTWIIIIVTVLILFLFSSVYLCCVSIAKDKKHNTYKCLSGFCHPNPHNKAKLYSLFSPTNMFIFSIVLIAVLVQLHKKSKKI